MEKRGEQRGVKGGTEKESKHEKCKGEKST